MKTRKLFGIPTRLLSRAPSSTPFIFPSSTLKFAFRCSRRGIVYDGLEILILKPDGWHNRWDRDSPAQLSFGGGKKGSFAEIFSIFWIFGYAFWFSRNYEKDRTCTTFDTSILHCFLTNPLLKEDSINDKCTEKRRNREEIDEWKNKDPYPR